VAIDAAAILDDYFVLLDHPLSIFGDGKTVFKCYVNPYIPHRETQKPAKISEITKIDLEKWHFDVEDDLRDVENDAIELAVLKNPYIHPEIISLSLPEVTLAQDSN